MLKLDFVIIASQVTVQVPLKAVVGEQLELPAVIVGNAQVIAKWKIVLHLFYGE